MSPPEKPQGAKLSLYFTVTMLAEIEVEAQRLGWSRSQVVAAAVRLALPTLKRCPSRPEKAS